MANIESILGSFYAQHRALIDNIQLSDPFPDTIYHYTSASGLNGILDSKTIWFTRWDFLNDLTEHQIIHKIIEECLTEFDGEANFTKHVRDINRLFQMGKKPNYFFSVDRDIYLASFSKDGDSLPLWMGYTKSSKHDGYNIGFNSKLIRETNDDLCIAPIIYDIEQQKCIIRNFIQHLALIWSQQTKSQHPKPDISQQIQHSIFDFTSEVGPLFKHYCYSHEAEVRIIVRANKENAKIRSANGLLIPYVPVPFEKKVVRNITVSPSLDSESASNGIRSAIETYGYKATICLSSLPFRSI